MTDLGSKKWKAYTVVLGAIGSTIAFAFSDLGQSLFYPPISLTIERGKDATQASDVWLKLVNTGKLPIRHVDAFYTHATILFTNQTGFSFEDRPRGSFPALTAASIDASLGQEFAVFENAHSYVWQGRSFLALGELTDRNPLFAYDVGAHKPHLVQRTDLPLALTPALVYGADFEVTVQYRAATYLPQHRAFRVTCRADVSGKPVWQVTPVATSIGPLRVNGHTHITRFTNTGGRAVRRRLDGDSHITVEIPADFFTERAQSRKTRGGK